MFSHCPHQKILIFPASDLPYQSGDLTMTEEQKTVLIRGMSEVCELDRVRLALMNLLMIEQKKGE